MVAAFCGCVDVGNAEMRWRCASKLGEMPCPTIAPVASSENCRTDSGQRLDMLDFESHSSCIAILYCAMCGVMWPLMLQKLTRAYDNDVVHGPCLHRTQRNRCRKRVCGCLDLEIDMHCVRKAAGSSGR
jgi:hypothetical protein